MMKQDLSKSDYEIEPIKSIQQISKIKNNLTEVPRDLTLFSIGTSSNINIMDLISVKISQVDDLLTGKELTIVNGNKNFKKKFRLKKEEKDAIDQLLFSLIPFESEDYFFQSEAKSQITIEEIDELVKKWCRSIDLNGNFSALTLNKTWGYIQKTVYDASLETIMLCLHLKSPEQTIKFLHL